MTSTWARFPSLLNIMGNDAYVWVNVLQLRLGCLSALRRTHGQATVMLPSESNPSALTYASGCLAVVIEHTEKPANVHIVLI